MAATFSADRALTLRAGIADSESRGVEFLRHFQEFLGSLKILGQAFQIPGLRWFGLRIARPFTQGTMPRRTPALEQYSAAPFHAGIVFALRPGVGDRQPCLVLLLAHETGLSDKIADCARQV